MATGLTDSRLPDFDVPHVAGRRFRHAYGFDDVAIVPGTVTVDPADVDVSWQLGRHRLSLPILAGARGGGGDPPFAQALGRVGGLAVLNLEGLQTKYDRPAEQLQRI